MISLVSESFAYDDGVPLLVELELSVEAGEYVVIAGASSSGKTTLARLLAGQAGSDAGCTFRGSLTLDGETIRFIGDPGDPRIDPAAWSARVGFVAQGSWGQLSMMSATVAEEIAFGSANRGVAPEDLRALVAEVASAMNLMDLLDRDPRKLSGGQLQRTIIAAAVAQRPRVLILDEPFQGLDGAAAAGVAEALEMLRAGGTAVVVCEPTLPRTAPSDIRVVALADGRAVFTGPLAETRWAGLRRYGIGTAGEPPRLAARPAARPVQAASAGSRPVPDGSAPGEVAVAMRSVTFTYSSERGRLLQTERRGAAGSDRAAESGGMAVPGGAAGLRDVDLSVRTGEVVAVRGANGSGKSTLLQHLNGLCRADAGTVLVDGVTIARQPTGILARHVGYLIQDTDQQLFERTVLREVSYGPLLAGERRAAASLRASAALERVGLAALTQAHPYELGFVQRRLVALASIMATGPRVWALDEPTAGLDDPTRTLMAELVLEHAATGGSVVMATHDDAFADTVAGRSIRLERGRVVPSTAPTDLPWEARGT